MAGVENLRMSGKGGGSGGWLGNGMRGVVGGRARGGRGGEEELVGVGLGGMVW